MSEDHAVKGADENDPRWLMAKPIYDRLTKMREDGNPPNEVFSAVITGVSNFIANNFPDDDYAEVMLAISKAFELAVDVVWKSVGETTQ